MSTEIAITCAAALHERRTVKVATFERGQDGRWLDGGLDDWPEGRTVKGQRINLQLRGSRVTTHLVGDEVAEPSWDKEQPDPDLAATRLRHRLQCRLCRTAPLLVRGEILDPILDRAEAAGVSTIPFGVLAARLP